MINSISNRIQPFILLLALAIFSGFGALGGPRAGSADDSKAKKFVDAFFKEKFFEQVDD
jgi:hypothetical protein